MRRVLKMSRPQFLAEVQRLFSENSPSPAAQEYLNQMIGRTRSDRANDIRQSILEVIQSNSPRVLDRSEIHQLLGSDTDVSLSQISALAGQLVRDSLIKKTLERSGKRRRVVYHQ